MEFLTTSEAADYLRLGERKLYELVTTGAIPCTKVTGKWLFPRHELDLWVLSGLARPAGMLIAEPPPVVGGSQDELLDWCLRESGSNLGSMSEGSARGLERLQRDEVMAVAVHFHSLDADGNLATDASATVLRDAPDLHDAVLVAFVRREQGLVLPPGNPKRLRGLSDVLALGARMAMRQQGTGAQMLLDVLLKRAGASTRDLRRVEPPALTGPDLAEIVRAGQADCGIATRAAARSAGLDFVPLVWERFDLAMRYRDYFRAPLQHLLRFIATPGFAARARELTGYEVSEAGQVRSAP